MNFSNDLIHRKYIFQKHLQYFLMRSIIPKFFFTDKAYGNSFRIFANSFPKAGTHLLRHVLSMMPGVNDRLTYHYSEGITDYKKQLRSCQKGQIVSAHMKWNHKAHTFLQEHDFKVFFMIRDLRDIAVSNAHYLAKDKRHRLYNHFHHLDTSKERLTASIEGIDADRLPDGMASQSIGSHARQYLPWIKDDNCLFIRFEDLVGPKGGGSTERQLMAISQIANHLQVTLSMSQLQTIAKKTFTPNTKTFRKGQIGGWRQEFTESHRTLFQKTAGKELISFGYERNNDW